MTNFLTPVLNLLSSKNYTTTPRSKETIGALWRLEKIILDTLDFNEAVQKIVDSTLTELGYLNLGYRIIVLALVNHEKNELQRIAISRTSDAKKALELTPVPFGEIIIPLSEKDNICIKCVIEKKPFSTRDWYDILRPAYVRPDAAKIQSAIGIKTSMVYPVIYHGQPEGVLIFSLVKEEAEVTESEKELIQGLTDVVGIAVQNAKLYTSLSETSENLRQVNEKLKELDKIKDDFVSLASHELRTPMTAIKSYTWLVLNGKAGAVEPKVREYIERVYQSSERLITLVNDMLDISRIEGGRVLLRLQIFDITALLSDIRTEFQARVAEKNIGLQVNLSDVLQVRADREKIHQVLENLIGNAIRFTPPGGTITVSTKKTDIELEVSVNDTGPGMTAEDQKKLFTKFTRLENSFVSTPDKTTGLGLYICKQYVDLHHGKIWVDSKPGHGSTFFFSLPLNGPGTNHNNSHPDSQNST